MPDSTIFVVDDDQSVRDSIVAMIQLDKRDVESYSSVPEFLEHFSAQRPGCIILDLCMPRVGGFELMESLRDNRVEIPVIVITGHGDVVSAVRAMKNGAIDFLEKPFNPHHLLECVHQAIDEDAVRRAARATHDAIAERIARVTPREREVMDLVVDGKLTKEIAAELSISIKTVEGHRTRIMEKMQADCVADLVRLVVAHRQTGARRPT